MMEIARIEAAMIANDWNTFQCAFKKRYEKNFYICSFQKGIRDKVGIKYFITCHKWDYSKHEQCPNEYSYTFELQFQNDKKQSINIETCQWVFYSNKYDHHISTLLDVYVFSEDLWRAYGGFYYEQFDTGERHLK